MSHIYDEDLRDIIRSTALELGIRIQEGVYVQLTGPAYESPHEVKMCRILGGDAVGMSTACEAVGGQSHGDEDMRYILYIQSGLWYDRRSFVPQGGPGGVG